MLYLIYHMTTGISFYDIKYRYIRYVKPDNVY